MSSSEDEPPPSKALIIPNPHSASGPTLLPAPIASLVSLVSRSTTASIRLGSIIGGTVLDSARLGTLKGLEIGRAAAEGILGRAGREFKDDGWTDKGINIIRSSISLTQLLLSTSFEISLTTLNAFSTLAEAYVVTLDSIFGSTESSRAISAIVALIRREIEENEEGEGKVGVGDLAIGLSCFAVLQMKTRKRRQNDIRMELEWDEAVEELPDEAGGNEVVVYDGPTGEDIPPALLFQNLPESADISVTTTSTTTSTTTIEVVGASPPDFNPPPNAKILSESSRHDDNRPHYKIVYETITKKTNNKRMKREGGELIDKTTEDQGRVIGELDGPPPPVPLKERPKEKRAMDRGDERQSPGRSGVARYLDDPVEANQRKRISALSTTTPSIDAKKGKGKVKEGGRRSIKRVLMPKEREKDKRHSPSQSHVSSPKSRELPSRNSHLLPRASSPELRFTENLQRSGSSRSGIFHRESSISTSSSSSGLQKRESFIRKESSSAFLGQPDSHISPNHSRSGSYTPSIYTIRTSLSQTSLLLESSSSQHPAVFPSGHLAHNLYKYMRFASASYGQKFMRLLGIGNAPTSFPGTASHHAEHHAFSYHTSLPVDTILLSSFTDPGGGYDAEGEVNTGVPLVHFVAVDHRAQAVVVTCRGTLGLEDVLTDLTCEYANLELRGTKYRVHKGMLNSALLLIKKDSRLLKTIKSSLEQFPGYGLVLCGHSLGGGVAAILATLLSTPPMSSSGSYTTTNSYIQALHSSHLRIPEGRRIHCYAYGPPACVSESLRCRTRSLITSVVHGNDCVPSLSFGIIRDFWTVAVAFKMDTKGAKAEIRNRILHGLASGNVVGIVGDGDDWAWSVVKTCRASMRAEKLVPPGKVYKVQGERVFVKDEDKEHGGIKSMWRVKGWRVRDVETYFGEVGFGGGMFGDHNPGEYERVLEMLMRGLCGED